MKRLLLILLMPAIACGTTYYLDISRPDNSGDGLSLGAAKKTWIAAGGMDATLDALGDDGADDTVIVSAGAYGDISGGVLDKARTGPLTIVAETGTQPDINSVDITPGSPRDTLVNLVFDGFRVPDGFDMEDAHGVTIQNCEVSMDEHSPAAAGYYAPYWRFNGDFAIYMRDCNFITVDNCNIHSANRAVQLSQKTLTDYRPRDINITNNLMHNLSGDGISAENSLNLTIDDNTIWDIDCRRSGIGIIGNQSGVWTDGETLIQADTLAEGIYDSNSATRIFVYTMTLQEFLGTNTTPDTNSPITGQSSGETLTGIGIIDPVNHTDAIETLAYNDDMTNLSIQLNFIYRYF